MNWLTIIQACFVAASIVGVFTNGLVCLEKLGISVLSFLIIVVPLAITRVNNNKGFVRHASLVLLAFHCIANNALMWYVLSEKGQ